MTSSQDCSFLLVDGKVVVEAPGAHHPQHHALRGSRKDIQLSAGPHRFEYYHAASGPSAMMVAAWEVNPRDPKPQPQAIPGEVFRTGAIGTAVAGTLTMRKEKVVPDFVAAILHSVPLPDNDVPLIGVQFRSISPRAISSNLSWNFGDGQSSEVENPAHVYLRPGLYTVKLAYRRGGNPLETTNRIYVDQPKITDNEKRPKLEEYLTVLRGYDPRTLDAVSLRQWILAFQAKAEALQATAEEETPSPRETEEDPEMRGEKTGACPGAKDRIAPLYRLCGGGGQGRFDRAVGRGRRPGPLEARSPGRPHGTGPVGRLEARRFDLGRAGRKISAVEPKAECQIEAADIAVNDMASAPLAKTFLDAADQSLRGSKFCALAAQGARARRLLCARGRWQIRRKSYLEAEAAYRSRRNNTELTAWQGAHGRSTEQFIKSGELDRAIAEIRKWEEDFPSDKVTGYLTLMYARYWAARHAYSQAIALAGQLNTVNPDSPYIDQILLLAAEWPWPKASAAWQSPSWNRF